MTIYTAIAYCKLTNAVTPQPKIEYSKSKDSDRDPASLSLRTIKKGRGGPVFSNNGDGVLGLRAVQDAIG